MLLCNPAPGVAGYTAKGGETMSHAQKLLQSTRTLKADCNNSTKELKHARDRTYAMLASRACGTNAVLVVDSERVPILSSH